LFEALPFVRGLSPQEAKKNMDYIGSYRGKAIVALSGSDISLLLGAVDEVLALKRTLRVVEYGKTQRELEELFEFLRA